MKIKLISITLLFCFNVFGFIAPIPYILDLVREERKTASEIVLRHQIEVRPSETVILEERIAHRSGSTLILWTLPAERQSASALWDARGYVLGKDRAFSPLVSVWMKYLVASSSDELQQALTTDGFLRREQLAEFRAGFVPQGDPQTWQFKDNYLVHPNIFLERLPSGVSIAVVGYDEGGKRRTVYFDKDLRGIDRLEWKEGPHSTVAWSMNNFIKTGVGLLPKHFAFESNGRVLIQTQLLQANTLGEKSWTDFRGVWKNYSRSASSLSSTLESALKVLLSVR